MEREGNATVGGFPGMEGLGAELAEFIQQQVQSVLQTAIPHIVQQISERAVVPPATASPLDTGRTTEMGNRRLAEGEGYGYDHRESKVATPEKFSGKKGGEVYKWFAQLRLVFRGKPRSYAADEDKIAYALSYMTGAAQNWAMPILQALDDGRPHKLLSNYDEFREAVIAVYGDIDRRSNAEDRLGRIRQTGSVASYISSFNEHAAQVDWNEASLMARFRGGLKDEVLDSIATAETQPIRLHEWMAMASRIDERLWARRQGRRPSLSSSAPSRDQMGRFPTNPSASGPVPMELDVIRGTTAMAKTAAERLEYQRQGRCWGCGQLGHVRSKCPTNPSTPLSLAAMGNEGEETGRSGKGTARD